MNRILITGLTLALLAGTALAATAEEEIRDEIAATAEQEMRAEIAVALAKDQKRAGEAALCHAWMQAVHPEVVFGSSFNWIELFFQCRHRLDPSDPVFKPE